MSETPAGAAPSSPAPTGALGKKAKRGVAWSFLREGVTEILVFPSSMILARLLTPEEFGIAAAAGFFTLLAGRLSELGFNAALVRSKVLRREHLSTVFVVNVAVGAITFAVVTAIAPLVARFYNSPETGNILPVAALGFLIVPLGTVPAALLSREMRFRHMTLVDWYHTVTFALATVVLAWLGFSYMSMVYGRLAALAAMTVSRIAFARWRPSLRFSGSALREIFPFGAGVHAKRLLDYTAQNIDNLIVGKFFGMATLGIYDKAFSTMNRVLARLNTGGPGVTFRVFSIIYDQPDRFRRAYHKVVMSTTLLAFPLFAVLVAVAPRFIVLLFGDRWAAAADPFRLLCLAGCLKLLNTYASSANQAAGQVWSEVWRQLLYVGLIVGSLIALQGWGAIGAASGVLLATCVMAVLMHVLLTRITHLRWMDVIRPQVPALLCAAGAASVVLVVERVLLLNGLTAPWLVLAAQGLAASLFYVGFVLFAPLASLRALVRDVAEDLVPGSVKRLRWVQLYLDVG